jgi:hypothetical protein
MVLGLTRHRLLTSFHVLDGALTLSSVELVLSLVVVTLLLVVQLIRRLMVMAMLWRTWRPSSDWHPTHRWLLLAPPLVVEPWQSTLPRNSRCRVVRTPLLITPLPITPLTITPLTITPLTITPLTITSHTITPLIITPLTITPLPITPLPITPLIITPLLLLVVSTTLHRRRVVCTTAPCPQHVRIDGVARPDRYSGRLKRVVMQRRSVVMTRTVGTRFGRTLVLRDVTVGLTHMHRLPIVPTHSSPRHVAGHHSPRFTNTRVAMMQGPLASDVATTRRRLSGPSCVMTQR